MQDGQVQSQSHSDLVDAESAVYQAGQHHFLTSEPTPRSIRDLTHPLRVSFPTKTNEGRISNERYRFITDTY